MKPTGAPFHFPMGNRSARSIFRAEKPIPSTQEDMKMKKTWLLLAVLLLSLLPAAFAEDAPTVTFKRLTVPADAESIDLGKVVVDYDEFDRFYAFLDKLPNLKKVDMFSTEVTRRNIQALAARFPNIEFGWTMFMGGHRIRTDLTSWSTRHNNNSERHTSEDFSILKYCKSLVALDIGHNVVDDLSFLYDLPNLRVLILADNKIKDVTPIASLKNLQYLELFLNDIEDVTPLAELDNLVDLNLCTNRITDLSPLEKMTGLQRLWLARYHTHFLGVPFDESQVDALRAALPNTDINTTAYAPTEEGWREHPRYEVIKRIFARDGQYEPFPDAPLSGSGAAAEEAQAAE